MISAVRRLVGAVIAPAPAERRKESGVYMRSVLALAATGLFLSAAAAPSAPAPAYAKPPAGMTTFYSGPTKVNLAGRPVVADIALHADMTAAAKGALKVALTTDVTKFVAETQADLKAYIAGRYNDCGERWTSSDPEISFPSNSIRFRMELTIEYWQCGWNGKSPPSRLTRDGGKVDVILAPFVESGKLQARLGDLSIVVTEGLGKYLPLEFLIKRALDGEMKKLNENPKFYRAPNPLYGELFRYESIAAKVDAEKRVLITARYGTNGNAKALDRIAARMKAEGVTQ